MALLTPRRLLVAALGIAALWAGTAAAQTPEQAQQAELEELRRRVAGQVQLKAFDLLDELVFEWSRNPPFGEPTPVALVGMTVPVGLGTGLQGLLEDHLATLLLANPTANVTLSACPACTSVVVHSTPQGTIVSRGADNPEALDKMKAAGARHGLHIDVAAEGAWLVLRARITKLTPDLPIVWSRTISSAASTASLLRHPHDLKSATDARNEYVAALEGRGPWTIPARFSLRTFAEGETVGIPAAPILWAQTGFEAMLSQARKWKATAVLGFAWLPEAYDGFMAETRVARLISGDTRSLIGPDVYMFVGGAIMTVDGPAVAQLVLQADTTRITYGGLHIGLEMRIGNRIGVAAFLENMPAYVNQDERVGEFLNIGLEWHSVGVEVSLCF